MKSFFMFLFLIGFVFTGCDLNLDDPDKNVDVTKDGYDDGTRRNKLQLNPYLLPDVTLNVQYDTAYAQAEEWYRKYTEDDLLTINAGTDAAEILHCIYYYNKHIEACEWAQLIFRNFENSRDTENSPIAVDDDYHVDQGTTRLYVLENDSDPNFGDSIRLHSMTNPAVGSARIDSEIVNGLLVYFVVYTSGGNDYDDMFRYTIRDTDGNLDSAIVTIYVRDSGLGDKVIISIAKNN